MVLGEQLLGAHILLFSLILSLAQFTIHNLNLI